MVALALQVTGTHLGGRVCMGSMGHGDPHGWEGMCVCMGSAGHREPPRERMCMGVGSAGHGDPPRWEAMRGCPCQRGLLTAWDEVGTACGQSWLSKCWC